jgi:pullulanase
VADPYARCLTGTYGRGIVLDLRRTDPEGFSEDRRPPFLGVVPDGTPDSPEDAVIYEAHLRDYTIASSSGVSRRGTYLGLAEAGTRGPGGVRTGLDHLVELGVTHVQLLPIQDFDNDEGSDDYNWGYMPAHWNSPDGWYATRREDATRVTECKRMVQALHGAGLRVVLDVVYNHTSGAASFDRVAPFYYFRIHPFTRSPYSNGSGCGNEFRSEAPMARKFIIESLEYWAREYHVDGFRFDLMGLVDTETMAQGAARLHAIDPSILVYGEPWTAAGTPIDPTTKGDQCGRGFGVFSDSMRDAIRGGNGEGALGYVQTGQEHFANQVKNGVEGAVNRGGGGFAADPGEVLNYVACHDNKTLWDKLEEAKAGPALQARMHRLATFLVLTSQGVPFLHGGQEMQRTKGGAHNSYDLPDRVNAIDWRWKGKNRETYEYTRGLIALRKAHPLFRLAEAGEILGRRLRFFGAPTGTIGYTLDGEGLTGETWRRAVVLVNGTRTEQTFSVPELGGGPLAIVADERAAGEKGVGREALLPGADGRYAVAVPPVSALLLRAK